MLVLLALAVASPLPEACHRPEVVQSLDAGWSLEQGVLSRHGETVLAGVHGRVAHGGGRILAAVVVEEPVRTDLALVEADGSARLLGLEAHPDRVALSPDGRVAAYVSGHTGYASLWVLPLDGTPRQLTNVDLVRTPGRAPEGFVPAPDGPPRFDGDLLRWTAADGEHAVSWR